MFLCNSSPEEMETTRGGLTVKFKALPNKPSLSGASSYQICLTTNFHRVRPKPLGSKHSPINPLFQERAATKFAKPQTFIG